MRSIAKKKTYCNPTSPSYSPHAPANDAGITGSAIDDPTRSNCKAVFTFEIPVGLTSAEGSEKSQYRAMVFGGGRDIHR